MPQTDQDRERLARAMSDFWRGGDGPSRHKIVRVLDRLDLEDSGGSKANCVYQAILSVPAAKLDGLVQRLLDLLHENGSFKPGGPDEADRSVIELLNIRLKPLGYAVTAGGEVFGRSSGLGIQPEALIDLPLLNDHIARIQVAMLHDDAEFLLGSSKELLEAVCRYVLTELGDEIPAKFPALFSRTLEVLGLHPKRAGDDEIGSSTRKILSGLQQIGLGINELRNSHGTGHGRVGAPKLGMRQARLAAGSASVLATVIVDTFGDDSAPWHKGHF